MTYLTITVRRATLERNTRIWRDETIDQAFGRLATTYADRPYIIADDAELSYADTWKQAELFARALRALGVGHGDRVALLMANYSAFGPLALGVWRLGASLVPVNFSFRSSELQYIVRQSRCKVLVTMNSFRDLNYLEMLEQIAPGCVSDPSRHFPDLKAIVQWGGEPAACRSVDDLLAIGAADNTPLPSNPATVTDIAVIMYTSGTTGAPKGACLTHSQELRNAYSLALHRAYEDGRRTIFALPLYHAFGLTAGLLACIWVGGSVVIRPIFDPEDMMRHIQKHRPSDALLVPTMAMAIVDHARLKDYDLASLSACLLASAVSPRWVWAKLKSGLNVEELVTGYGMTELTAAVLLTEPDDSIETLEQVVGHVMRAGLAGLPEHDGLIGRLKVVDQSTGVELPDGTVGELCWETPLATSQYFEQPEMSRALRTNDGWFRSGDLGNRRPDGYVQIAGRSKEQYKSGGELVSPREVEDVLCSHDDVAQAYVFGLPDERWGEIGAAYVVLAPGAHSTELALQAWCRDRLAKFKWPRHVFFCGADELPRTATGKVQKYRLIELARARLGSVVAS